MKLQPAETPTLYFIGVTTGQSSILKVFPKWADYLGLDNAEIHGIDFVPHDAADNYRAAVEFIKQDPLSLGALVTTHKLDLYAACRGMMDEIDPHAGLMAETSCLSKRNGRLICHAKDPISSGLSIDGFLPPNHFADTGAELLSMGAGGSTIAMTWHLMQASRAANRPSRILVTDCNPLRLEHIRHIHQQIGCDIPCEYIHVSTPEDNDRAMATLKPASMVVNATGLGKDASGSPLTDNSVFPERGIVWELNYRGELVFLDQARAQAESKALQIENGWSYFIHGWTQVIAEVFDITIPTSGPRFEEISRLAATATGLAS